MTTSVFPPGPKARFPLDLYVRFRSDRIGFLEEMASFGDVSHLSFNNMHLYLLNHPDMIRDLLVNNHRQFTKSRALHLAEWLLGKGYHVVGTVRRSTNYRYPITSPFSFSAETSSATSLTITPRERLAGGA